MRLEKLMYDLLHYINEHTPVRPCKVSSTLRRLQYNECLEYDSGLYYITQQGKLMLSADEETP
jgi:hypothetical protein